MRLSISSCPCVSRSHAKSSSKPASAPLHISKLRLITKTCSPTCHHPFSLQSLQCTLPHPHYLTLPQSLNAHYLARCAPKSLTLQGSQHLSTECCFLCRCHRQPVPNIIRLLPGVHQCAYQDTCLASPITVKCPCHLPMLAPTAPLLLPLPHIVNNTQLHRADSRHWVTLHRHYPLAVLPLGYATYYLIQSKHCWWP
jgi:hypothetical protein